MISEKLQCLVREPKPEKMRAEARVRNEKHRAAKVRVWEGNEC
jgi:hypothetical protein